MSYGRGTINETRHLGYLGRDPELKYTPNGSACCNFSLATKLVWKKDGQEHEKTDWHRCVAWNNVAELIAEHVKKGDLLYVAGRLQTRSYEQDGVKKYVTEIAVVDIEFVGKPKHEQQEALPFEEEEKKQEAKPAVDSDLPF